MARNIVLTGVSRGLGRALVEFLDAQVPEVRIFGCARSPEPLASLRAQISARHQLEVVDVADDPSVCRWAERVCALAVPDLLLNNAGLINAPKPLWELGAEEVAEVIDVNLIGVINTLRHFVPKMLGRTGVIVNLSSGWGRSTSPEVAPYCASKWAVEGLSRAVAQELPRGLACVTLNPGIIDTAMLRRCWADEASLYEDAATWARRAAPYLLQLGPTDNGRALTVPS